MIFSTEHKTINTFHFSAALNVLMILLIFFVLIFSFYSKSGVQLKLNRSGNPNLIGISKNAIVINGNDKIFIENEEINSDKLLEKFTSFKKDKFYTFILYPNKSTKFSTILNVINTAKKVGINNITIQADLVSP